MRDLNQITLLTAQPIATGGAPVNVGKDFPVGLGWYKTRIRIRIAVVIGTGAGLIANSGLLFVKNIFMKTDQNEILANLNGIALRRLNQYENNTEMFGATQVAAATGNTDIFLEIPHTLPKDWHRPLDTILDTGRYKSMTLQVTLGTIADLFTAPGTATVTATMDVEAVTSANILPAKAQPQFYRSLFNLAPVVPTVQTFVELDRAQDMSVMKMIIGTTSLATAGVAFTGAGSDIIIANFDVKDQNKFYQQSRLWGFSQSDDKSDYNLEAVQTGFTCVEFAKDRSVFSSLYTGNKNMVRLQWINGTAIGTDQVSVAYDAVRKLAS